MYDTINLGVVTINPDLEKERKAASFNPNDISAFLYGGPKAVQQRRQILQELFSDPVFDQEKRYFQSKTERYDHSFQQSIRLIELSLKKGWTEKQVDIAAGGLHYDLAIALHMVMFVPAILRLASDEQQSEWLPLAMTFQMIGTYAQTELGHGTNLKAQETTATFDRASDSFILNTPFPSGMKWWPGGLGKSTTHALVSAYLHVDGKDCGFQFFLVPLRDMETHEELPGVEVGDIGPRIAVSYTDNGYLILRNVKVPRRNMLGKYCRVNAAGLFEQDEVSEKSSYGTMMLVRSRIVYLSFLNTSQAVTIATRYAAVRRQSELIPMGPEPQILDFVTQQYKLIPNIALSYALFFTQKYMVDYYSQVFENEIKKDVFDSVPELHSQSCGLKAYSTDLSMDTVEVCRRSCGGHGFMMASGLCSLLMDGLGSVTYEGENTVLYLQTAKFIMKNLSSVRMGKKPARSLSFLSSKPSSLSQSADIFDFSSLKQIFNARTNFMVNNVASRMDCSIQQGLKQHEAWNKHSVELVRATKAYLDSFVAVNFIDALSEVKVPAEVKKVFEKLCHLHCFHRVTISAEEFLQSGAVLSNQVENIRSAEVQTMAELRPEAVALVDAFDYHDQTLNSALGRYDGNVYEKLYELTKLNPMNKQSVLPPIYKYLKPFQSKAKL